MGARRYRVTPLPLPEGGGSFDACRIEELLARINATLRRSKPSADGRPEPGVVRIGPSRSTWSAAGSPRPAALVALTPTEFALRREFAVSPGDC